MFIQIPPYEFTVNPVQLFRKDRALLTVGLPGEFNTMTIGWGSIGGLWNMPSVTVYVRPSRYTFEFMEQHDLFTVSSFGGRHTEELNLFGTKSGRDIDKIFDIPLTPIFVGGAPAFDEADIIFVCQKMARRQFDPSIVAPAYDEKVSDIYKGVGADKWHVMYVGEIKSVWVNDAQ